MPNRNQAQQIVRNAQKKKQEQKEEKKVQHGPHTHTHRQLVGSSKSKGEGGSKLTGYGHDMLAWRTTTGFSHKIYDFQPS